MKTEIFDSKEDFEIHDFDLIIKKQNEHTSLVIDMAFLRGELFSINEIIEILEDCSQLNKESLLKYLLRFEKSIRRKKDKINEELIIFKKKNGYKV